MPNFVICVDASAEICMLERCISNACIFVFDKHDKLYVTSI